MANLAKKKSKVSKATGPAAKVVENITKVNNTRTRMLMDGIEITSNPNKQDRPTGFVEYYDKKGKVVQLEKDACALCIKGGKNTTYKVMLDGKKKAFDPHAESPSYNLKTVDGIKRTPKFKMFAVNRIFFDNYILYLQTRQKSYYKIAHREI